LTSLTPGTSCSHFTTSALARVPRACPWVIQGGSHSLAKPCVAGTHTCVCECMYVCVRECMYVCVRECMYVCVCACRKWKWTIISPGNKTGSIILRIAASELEINHDPGQIADYINIKFPAHSTENPQLNGSQVS
jgi:hypothetical protein